MSGFSPLPLATDPEVFSPERARSSRRPQAVTFVGNSLAGSVEQKLARLPRHQEFKELFEEASRATDLHPGRCLDALLIPENLREHPLICGLDRQELTDFKAALLWRATLKYRLACVKELAPFKPVIYGDSGWRGLVDKKFQLRPEVNYYDELPQVYAASAINFNATSLQMRAAINQRMFDAPAAGGFVLTDFREQLAELFQVGEEVACYQEPGEIPELVQFYLEQPQVRERMTAKARQRVLAEHTYRHRVAVMLDTMRRSL